PVVAYDALRPFYRIWARGMRSGVLYAYAALIPSLIVISMLVYWLLFKRLEPKTPAAPQPAETTRSRQPAASRRMATGRGGPRLVARPPPQSRFSYKSSRFRPVFSSFTRPNSPLNQWCKKISQAPPTDSSLTCPPYVCRSLSENTPCK